MSDVAQFLGLSSPVSATELVLESDTCVMENRETINRLSATEAGLGDSGFFGLDRGEEIVSGWPLGEGGSGSHRTPSSNPYVSFLPLSISSVCSRGDSGCD